MTEAKQNKNMSKQYELPEDAGKRAEGFDGLTAHRKSELLAHVRATPAERQSDVIHQIIVNGGDEAKFLRHILAKGDEAAPEKDAPHNKRVSPPQTK
jgi:hypothetical protein